jgi:hypothetical protein
MKINIARAFYIALVTTSFLAVCAGLFALQTGAQRRDQAKEAVSAPQNPVIPIPTPDPSCAELNASTDPAFVGITSDWEFTFRGTPPPTASSTPHSFVSDPGGIPWELTEGTPSSSKKISISGSSSLNNGVIDSVSFNSEQIIRSAIAVSIFGAGNVYIYPGAGTHYDSALKTPDGQPIAKFAVCFQPPPTAADVSISGSVVRIVAGRRIGLAKVRITVVGGGETFTVLTNWRGWYHIEGLEAGQTYVVIADHKFLTFVEKIKVVTASSNLDAVDFEAEASP